jgi:hypothetical protein
LIGCASSRAYRWRCGGAPINHDLLAELRRENAATLDRLLSQSLTGLIAEKLVRLEVLAQPHGTAAGSVRRAIEALISV